MYKASIELARINKGLKLKFGLIIESETEKKEINKLVHKFEYNGNSYMRINPRPFITLDISSMTPKSEGWNSNQVINFNKVGLYMFIRNLSYLIKQFKEIKSLYYYENTELKIDTNLSEKLKMVGVSNNKHWLLRPCIVPDDEIADKNYEGCVFCINDYSNYCYISYSEMEYLLYELKHIDMVNLSMMLINTVKLYENMEEEKIKMKPVEAPKEEEYNETTKYIHIEQAHEIPEI